MLVCLFLPFHIIFASYWLIFTACQGRETLDNWTCARCASATQRGDGKKSNNKESQEKCFAAYKNIKCEICRESEGSMIQKPDGDWVHNTCILWIPGYEFPLPASQEIKRKKRHYPYVCIFILILCS